MIASETRVSDGGDAMAPGAQAPGQPVLRPLLPKQAYAAPDGRRLLTGAIVDTETTGLRHGHDKIVELGMVVFEYDAECGQVYRVLDTYNAFDDPGMPIPAATTAIHGITDEMVAGQAISTSHVENLLDGVAIVIAHNAAFDRPFLEERLPVFQALPWACSLAQVNWRHEGFVSMRLASIAAQLGFSYHAHRAGSDCLALLEALQQDLPVSGAKGFKHLLDAYTQSEYRIWARGAPFNRKDLLKERAYRWDPDERCWYKTMSQPGLPTELDWLKAHIYGSRAVELELDVVDARNRFSKRISRMRTGIWTPCGQCDIE